jgi:PAS domain S-box-containing protein
MNSRISRIRVPRIEGKHNPPHLATVVAASHDPIIGATTEGTVVSWNPAAEKLFGRTAREAKGVSISQIISAEHLDEFRRMLGRAVRGSHVRHFESVCAGKDGRRIDVSLNVSPIKHQDGTVAGVVAIVRDITRRLRGRETLLRRNRELLTYHRLSQIVLSSRSLQESYRDIADEIRAATGFPIAAIAIVDEARQTIVFHGLKGRGIRSNLPTSEYPVDTTLSGVVIRTGKPLIVTHVLEHPRYRSLVLRRTRAQTFAGYPLRVGQKIIGCLNLAHTRNVDINDETAKWIEGLANYVAVLAERKRAEEELRTSREQLRELSRWTQSAVEEERKRIAREIHDRLGQELSLLQLELGLLQDRLPKGEKDLRTQAKSMTRLIDSAIRSVQKISTDLRPTLLDNLGLGAAVDWAVREFQKHTGIRCRVFLDPPDLKLDQERSTAFFRILQEALTNILRHARATRVEVLLEKREEAVVLKIRDNGRGIPLHRIRDSKSVGLTGMRERVHPWGGSVAINGRQARGTEVVVTIPSSP